jgi:flagellar biosynthetic protein FliR
VTIAATELLIWAQAALWSGFAVFLRIGAMMALIPAFGEQSVPVRVRLGLAVAFTLVVLPAVSPEIGPAPSTAPALLVFLLAEVTNGILFGLMLRLFVIALLMAGTIIAQSTSISQIYGGSASSEPSPAIGHILVSAGLALAAILGLHVQLAAFVITSYDLVAPGIFPTPQTVMTAGLGEVTRSLSIAFSLSAPFVIAALAYNLVLGVINKAMPQLMVTFVGAPALTAGGLVLLVMTVPLLLAVWSSALMSFLAMPFGALP